MFLLDSLSCQLCEWTEAPSLGLLCCECEMMIPKPDPEVAVTIQGAGECDVRGIAQAQQICLIILPLCVQSWSGISPGESVLSVPSISILSFALGNVS